MCARHVWCIAMQWQERYCASYYCQVKEEHQLPVLKPASNWKLLLILLLLLIPHEDCMQRLDVSRCRSFMDSGLLAIAKLSQLTALDLSYCMTRCTITAAEHRFADQRCQCKAAFSELLKQLSSGAHPRADLHVQLPGPCLQACGCKYSIEAT